MSQSCFSLGFLSHNSLWKLSTFRGYKGIYSSVCEEYEKLVFIQTGHSGNSISQVERVMILSRKQTAWPDCTFCPVVHQLLDPSVPCMLHTCATLATCQLRVSSEIQSQDFFDCTYLEFSSHSLTHNPYINPT